MPSISLDSAIALFNEGRLDEAQGMLEALVREQGPNVDAYEGLARIAARTGRIALACDYADQAAAMAGAGFGVHEFAAIANKIAGNRELALAHFARCMALAPNHLQTVGEYADLASLLGRHDQAHQVLARALRAYPRVPALHYVQGRVLGNQARYAEEIAAYQRALALDPGLIDAYVNAGVAYRELRRFDDALAMFKKALRLNDDHAGARNNRAITNLMRGQLEHGWRDYEWRWRDGVQKMPLPGKPWLGESSIAGQTLLVHAEQGFGDTVQFMRYLPLLRAHHANVIFAVQAPLKALVQAQLPDVQVIAQTETMPAHDRHVPLMSLPLALFKQHPAVPASDPYVQPDAELVRVWRDRLSALPGAGSLTVGIAWHCVKKSHTDPRASELSDWSSLLDLPCRFVSLQKDVPQADAQTLAAHPRLFDAGRLLTDFADTASLVSQLDLVVTIDTVTAHVAGALGVPVWVALPYQGDWRWQLDRTDSPWYGSMTLIRQGKPGGWAEVVGTIRERLSLRLLGA